MTIDVEIDDIILRRPGVEDGAPLNLFIRTSPPLDMNSVYCNVLQCTHFSDTCVIAEKQGQIVGYVTGYRMPAEPDVYFLWQVGVGAEGRGKGLNHLSHQNLEIHRHSVPDDHHSIQRSFPAHVCLVCAVRGRRDA